MKYIIGIDSGASSSEAVIMPYFSFDKKEMKKMVIDSSWLNVKRKQYPPVNFNLVGPDETVKRLYYIIKNISSKGGMENIVSAACGISGARYEKDRKDIAARLYKETGIKRIKILPDTEIAFASAFDEGEKNCGILIAGTGSILYYKNSRGILNRAGGWGRIIGDEGSGYWIAKKAFSCITKNYDISGKKILLVKTFEKELGINETTLIKKIYHDGFDIAKAARLVFRAAEKGDALSRTIIKEAAGELAAHFKPLKKTKYSIALTGSLFSEEKMLEAELKKITNRSYKNIKLIKPARHPVWGAVKIAVKEAPGN